MKKNMVRSWIALALVFAVFQVIAFVIPFTRTGAFWVGYAFTDVAILVQVYIFHTAFKGNTPAKSKLYGFPIARLGLIYAVVQLLLGVVFMAAAKALAAWIPAVICSILLAAAAIGTISTEAMRDEIVRQDAALKKDVQTMRKLQSLVAALPAQAKDAEVKQALQALSEKLQYSDPVSGEALAETEQELAVTLQELQQAVLDGSRESTLQLCARSESLLAERNRLCKLNK